MILEITSSTKPNEILKHFMECGPRDNVNLKTSFGFVTLVGGIKGGILSKLEGNDLYFGINNKWVKDESKN